ncbi:MAG: hypothetical protein EGQ83_00610, partial [Holdemanella biformis]|nr:hypothetical protein [Holdemanella biformis]
FMVTHKAWKKNLLIKYLCPRDFRRGEMEEIMKMSYSMKIFHQNLVLIKLMSNQSKMVGMKMEHIGQMECNIKMACIVLI